MGLFGKKKDEDSKDQRVGILSKMKTSGLQKKAESGDISAQYELATNYLTGKDVKRSLPDAVRWMSMAANGGLMQAQIFLGDLCYDGKDIPPQYENAFRWYVLASNQGDPHSMYRCG